MSERKVPARWQGTPAEPYYMNQEACARLVAEHGSQAKAGRAIGVSQTAVSKWANPEVLERARERDRERYATDPEYRERKRERRATDTEYRERELKLARKSKRDRLNRGLCYSCGKPRGHNGTNWYCPGCADKKVSPGSLLKNRRRNAISRMEIRNLKTGNQLSEFASKIGMMVKQEVEENLNGSL